MHEIGAVSEAAQRLIQAVGDEPVASVTVRVGPGVSVDVAATAWREAVEGSVVAGARVDWRRAYHLLRCLECGTDYFGAELTQCPACCGTGLVIAETPLITVGRWRPAGASANQR